MSKTTLSSAPYNECLERAEAEVIAALGVRRDDAGDDARPTRPLELDGPAVVA